MPLLTPEKLSAVTWAMAKLEDAEAALERLRQDEPATLPPDYPGGTRYTEITAIRNEVARLRERLETIYS